MKIKSFNNGGDIEKFQNSGDLPLKVNLPRSQSYMVPPDYPSDEMVALNQRYDNLTKGLEEYINGLSSTETPTLFRNKYWMEHPELRDKIGEFENGYSTLMGEYQNLIDSGKDIVGKTEKGYNERYGQYLTNRINESLNSVRKTVSNFSRNIYELGKNLGYTDEDKQFMEDYSSGKISGPFTGRQQYLAEDANRMARINAGTFAGRLNQSLGTNYNWQQAQDIMNLMEKSKSESNPEIITNAVKWAPGGAGTFGSSNIYDQMAQYELSSRPSIKSLGDKYPEAYRGLIDDPFRAQQIQKAITQGSIALAGMTAAGASMVSPIISPMLKTAGSSVANYLGNGLLARTAGHLISHPLSTALSGLSTYGAIDNFKKGDYRNAAIDTGFAILPFLGEWGRFLKTPSAKLMFENSRNYTAFNNAEMLSRLTKAANSGDMLRGYRIFNPSTASKIVGDAVQGLPNFAFGANSAYNLYNDNFRLNLSPGELKSRNISNGIGLGMASLSPILRGVGYLSSKAGNSFGQFQPVSPTNYYNSAQITR